MTQSHTYYVQNVNISSNNTKLISKIDYNTILLLISDVNK